MTVFYAIKISFNFMRGAEGIKPAGPHGGALFWGLPPGRLAADQWLNAPQMGGHHDTPGFWF